MNDSCIGLAVLTGLLLGATAAAAPDHTPFDQLLRRHVHGSQVDYQGFEAERKILADYIDSLADIKADRLNRDDRMALFINAYNAATILLILEHDSPKFGSIKDIPRRKRWVASRWRIGGKVYSLDDIEHRILRPEFADPRVHTAINCASIGCPDLRAESYTGERLSFQLDEQAARFVNDPRHVQVKGNTLYLSAIFKWFGDDFEVGGRTVRDFLLRYADPELGQQIKALGASPKVSTLEYDWSLNRYIKAPASPAKSE